MIVEEVMLPNLLTRFVKIPVMLILVAIIGYGLVLFAVSCMSSNSAFAVASTISMSLSTNSLSLDIIPTADGKFAQSDNMTVSVSTNNYTGYKLSVLADNSTDLVSLDNNNKTIPSLDSGTVIDENTFSTSSTYNNMWGYKPSKYCTESNNTFQCANNTSFRASPPTTSDVIGVTNVANSTADDYTIAIGARITTSTIPGSYSNTFTLTAVANPVTYSITYNNGNTTDTVSDLPASVSNATTYADNVTLSSTVPTRTGFTFSGWCTVMPTTSAGVDNCPGFTYTAGATNYPIDMTSNNNSYTLYAMWTVITYTQTVNYYYQNASGGAGSVMTYTEDVAYGSNFTFTSAKASSFSSTTHNTTMYTTNTGSTTKTINYTVTGESTNTVYFHRNTRTIVLTKGTGISAVSVTGTGIKSGSGTESATVYYGGTVTITATLSSGYTWVNWTGSTSYTSRSQSISNITSNLSFTANGRPPYMQTISAAQLATLMPNIGDSATLYDNRDETAYTVAKLADGKYWTTMNLRLDLSNADVIISADNTNNPTSSFISSANTHPASKLSWCDSNSSSCFNQINHNTSNIGNTTVDSGGHTYDEYGVYYNWYTATAGNGTYSTKSESTVSGDICPKGWHLPSGYTSGDFIALSVALGGLNTLMDSSTNPTGATMSATLRSAPNNFVYSGYLRANSANSSIQGRNSYGYYWSSTARTNNLSYLLNLQSSRVAPADNGFSSSTYFDKDLGLTVRCIKSS